MRNDVVVAIENWASRPTWFSPHPMDAKELRKAVSNLKKLSPRPTIEEIAEAIHHHVLDAPKMAGTPSDIGQAIYTFATNIHSKINK